MQENMMIPTTRSSPVWTNSNTVPGVREKTSERGCLDQGVSFESHGLECFRNAMRSSNYGMFRKWILRSKERFGKAAVSYRFERKRAFELRCLAHSAYLEFFLTSNALEKKKQLEKSWRLAKCSLRIFDETGDHLGFARTYDRLAPVAGLAFDFHFSPKLRGLRLKEGVEYGRQSATGVQSNDDKALLARVCAKTALFIDAIGNEGSEIELNEERDKEGLELWKKAEQLENEEALFQLASPPSGFYRIVDEEESHRIHNEALIVARKRKDHFAIGWMLSQQTGWSFFDGIRALSLADSIRSMKQSLENSEEAARMLSASRFTNPNCGLMWPDAPYAEHFLALSWFQTDEKSRMLLLQKALHETPFLLKQARMSGYPQALAYADHVTSKVLMELGLSEAGSRRKMKLLRRALRHRLRACRITAKVQPNDIHRNATYSSRLGEIQAGLAELSKDRRAKIRMLSRAVEDKGKSMRLAADYANAVSHGQSHLLRRALGVDLIVYGDLLMRLYKASEDEETLGKAAKAYSDAARFLKESTAYRRLGEALWKAGEIHDRLRAYIQAAEDFTEAAKAYRKLAEKRSDAGPVFLDYALYLEAWSNIESARASHIRSDYAASEKFFEKAADIHKLANRWAFLSPYYTALAKLESAENFSRIGNSLESVSAFGDAAKMFRESKLSLQKHVGLMDQPEEKTMVEGIALAFKEEYSLARGLIEEARIAEDQGDNQTSANKFGDASRILHESSRIATMKRERGELRYIATLSSAWEQMARTSLTEPGSGFDKAAQIFDQSIEYGPDEISINMAVGHKHFCQALSASSKFAQSLDSSNYRKAVDALTVASTRFAGAGFPVQSKHALACKLLLDAHMQIARADKNPDSAQQVRGYEQVTAILRDAAENFGQAQQTAKQGEVLRLIDRVHEQFSLSQQLAEISKPSAIVSPTVAFPIPATGGESPISPSRFVGADIEATYGASIGTSSGEDGEVLVEVAVVNTGSLPIRVVKISGIAPEGTRIVKGQGFAAVERGSISLDQTRVDSMRLETFKIRLRTKKSTPVILTPSVSFVDENGHSFERNLPLRIIVPSPILDFLAKEFVEDYGVRRFNAIQSGWRTLSGVVSALKIPKNQVYGDSRWGRAYGRQLKTLIDSGLIEARKFGGERGRGGQIEKVRLAYDNNSARRYMETQTVQHTPFQNRS